MSKMHRSANGKLIDMEKLRLQNELVPALGNMKVNARGDQLGSGGKIIKTREQIMDEYHNANTANHQPVEPVAPTQKKVIEQPIARKSRPIEKPSFTPGSLTVDEVPASPVKKRKKEKEIKK